MRHESSRLLRQAQLLDDALRELAESVASGTRAAIHSRIDPGSMTTGSMTTGSMTTGSITTGSITTAAALLGVLRATADNLDEAGAVLQRYATELAEGHELGRRAERRVEEAGLLLEGTRVIEPWGPASATEAERRRAQVPEVQARVDLATAHVGRARGRLDREVSRLAEGFMEHSRVAHSARREPGAAAPARAWSRTRLGP